MKVVFQYWIRDDRRLLKIKSSLYHLYQGKSQVRRNGLNIVIAFILDLIYMVIFGKKKKKENEVFIYFYIPLSTYTILYFYIIIIYIYKIIVQDDESLKKSFRWKWFGKDVSLVYGRLGIWKELWWFYLGGQTSSTTATFSLPLLKGERG